MSLFYLSLNWNMSNNYLKTYWDLFKGKINRNKDIKDVLMFSLISFIFSTISWLQHISGSVHYSHFNSNDFSFWNILVNQLFLVFPLTYILSKLLGLYFKLKENFHAKISFSKFPNIVRKLVFLIEYVALWVPLIIGWCGFVLGSGSFSLFGYLF